MSERVRTGPPGDPGTDRSREERSTDRQAHPELNWPPTQEDLAAIEVLSLGSGSATPVPLSPLTSVPVKVSSVDLIDFVELDAHSGASPYVLDLRSDHPEGMSGEPGPSRPQPEALDAGMRDDSVVFWPPVGDDEITIIEVGDRSVAHVSGSAAVEIEATRDTQPRLEAAEAVAAALPATLADAEVSNEPAPIVAVSLPDRPAAVAPLKATTPLEETVPRDATVPPPVASTAAVPAAAFASSPSAEVAPRPVRRAPTEHWNAFEPPRNESPVLRVVGVALIVAGVGLGSYLAVRAWYGRAERNGGPARGPVEVSEAGESGTVATAERGRASASGGDDGRAAIEQAESALRWGNLEQALGLLKEELAKDPPSARARTLLSDVLREARGRTSAARQNAFDRGSAARASTQFRAATALETRAIAEWRAGRFDAALKLFSDAAADFNRVPRSPAAGASGVAPSQP